MGYNIIMKKINPKFAISGLGVSVGIGKGRAKIIRSQTDIRKFKKGEVLVTRITDPTMVAIMAKATAIVCDIGSLTSHPSIVSREMGIPCVVNTKKGSVKIKNGDYLEVNGKTGQIKIF